MAVDVGSAVGYLDLDISGFLAGLRTAQNEAGSATKNMATKVGGGLKTVGDKFTSVGSTLTKTVTLPLAGIATAGLKVATDFEKVMSQVKAISGATGKEFDSLREKAIELGADTAFSSNEVAEAMTEMAKAGWTSQQILDGMSGVLDAAAASGEGLGSVATIVADAITGFGMEAKESTRVADLLTQAANAGTIGVGDLGESFKYIAPVAATMGFSIEDVTTAISAMSMAGIKGSQAGTSLRTALVRMVKPNDNTAASMKELGIVLTNADGSFKSLGQIVTEMRSSFSGLTDEQKTYHAATLAGQEGMSGLLSLLNLTQEEYDAIADSMNNASGVAAETAAVMQDNLTSKVEQLGGSLESLAIKLADYVVPHLQKFVLWLTDLVDKFTELDPETQKSILKWGAFAIALGPVLVAVGKLTSGIGGVITAFGKAPEAFGKLQTGFININEGFTLAKAGFPAVGTQASKLGVAFAGVTAPMVAVVAAITVLIAAFATLWKTNEKFRNNLKKIWNQIKKTFDKFTKGIVDRLNQLGFNFKDITEVISAIWKGFCDLLAPYFEGVFQYIADIFEVIVNVILGVLDVFISIFKGDWTGAWNAIKGIFISIWTYIKDWFSNILNTLKGILNVALGWFGTSWEECWNGIKTFFERIWNGIVSFFTGILTGIQNTFTTVFTAMSTFFITTWTNIKTFFEGIWNGLTSFLSGAWETMKNIVQVGIMFIQELFNAAVQILSIPFRFIWENCKEIILSAWESIKTTVSTALNFIQNLITTVWNAVSSFFTTIWNAISNFMSSVWEGIKSIVSNAINSVKNTITTVFNAISSVVTTVWNAIKNTISTVLTSIKNTVSSIWNTIKSTISTVVNAISTTVSSVFNAIKSTTTTVWNAIKSAISTPINAAKDTVSSVVSTIKDKMLNGFDAAKETVSSKFDSIKNKISNVMESAKNAVSDAIDKIKSKFNFKWSLPKLKMPHPKVSGKFSLNPPSVPKFSIDWYKKAMNNPMILNGATIFGAQGGKLLGGGEAGSEVVSGTNTLMKMIREAVASVFVNMTKTIQTYFDVILLNIRQSNTTLVESVAKLIDISNQFVQASEQLGYVTYSGFSKAAEVIEKSNDKPGTGGGDTFVFNSPKAIDEIEAAKQMKQAKRDLEEGF